MALNLYTGQPGSGKSYSVVANVVIPALLKGRHVVTNIPLEVDRLILVYGGEITQLPLDALDNPDLPGLIPNGAVAIIDECWNRWPSGQRIGSAAKDDLHWLKEHRHRVDEKGNAMQVVLVTQDPSDLAAWVRKLIAHTFWMQKLDSVGMNNTYTVNIYKGCPTGENIPKRYLIRQSHGTYDPDVYQFYSSATQSKTLDVGNERAIDTRNSIWRDPKMWFQLGICPILFVASSWFAWGAIQKQIHPKKPAEQAATVEVIDHSEVNPDPPQLIVVQPAQVEPGAQPASTVQSVSELQPSPVWRIAGYIHRSDEPADERWASDVGYGVSSRSKPLRLRQPLAILQGYSGTRYVPLSDCDPYPDGINYSCDIDGARVTPWSGQMGITENVPGVAVSGARGEGFEQSENPPPRTTQLLPSAPAAPVRTGTEPVVVNSGKPGLLW